MRLLTLMKRLHQNVGDRRLREKQYYNYVIIMFGVFRKGQKLAGANTNAILVQQSKNKYAVDCLSPTQKMFEKHLPSTCM